MPTEHERAQRRKHNRTYYEKHQQAARREAERKIHFQCRLPGSLVGRIHAVTMEAVAAGKWPYKTIGDTVADLLVRGLGTLRGDEMIDAMMPYLELMQSVNHEETHEREMRSLSMKVRTRVSALLGIGADRHALACYGNTMERIEKMPESIWTVWLMKELQTAFPEMERHYRKGGTPPVTIKFHKDRRYKFSMDEDHEEQKTARQERDLRRLGKSFGKKKR